MKILTQFTTGSRLRILIVFCFYFSTIGNAQVFDYEKNRNSNFSVRMEEKNYGKAITNYYKYSRSRCTNPRNPDCYTHIENIDLRLDLYTPDMSNNQKRAVLIIVPGSGRGASECVNADCNGNLTKWRTQNGITWLESEQRNYNRVGNTSNFARNLAKKGVVVAVLNTRYTYHTKNKGIGNSIPHWKSSDSQFIPNTANNPNILSPIAEEFERLVVDVKRAIRWISADAQLQNYNIDPNNIFTYGSSGAAKMASLAAVLPSDALTQDDPNVEDQFKTDNNLNVTPKPVRGVIYINGDTQGRKHHRYMNPGTAFMFWHGTDDPSILHGEVEMIEERCLTLDCLGSQLYSLPGVGHGASSGKFRYSNGQELTRDQQIYQFIGQYATRGQDNRPEVSIVGNTQFKENDGNAVIQLQLNKPAPAGGVSFTVAADQMREVSFINTTNSRFQDPAGNTAQQGSALIAKHTAKGQSEGTLNYKSGKAFAHKDARSTRKYDVMPNTNNFYVSDFTETRRVITIPEGRMNATFRIPLTVDGRAEQNECFKVRILNASRVKIKDFVKYITILDGNGQNTNIPDVCVNYETTPSPTPPTITFQNATLTINEDVGTLVLPVTSSTPVPSDVTLEYATRNQTAKSNGTSNFDGTRDFGYRRGTITLSKGSSVANIEIPIIDDTAEEPLENFKVLLTSTSANATLGMPNEIIVNIRANDAPVTQKPTIAFNKTQEFVNEGSGTKMIKLIASSPVPNDVTIDYATRSETARSDGTSGFDGTRDFEYTRDQATIKKGTNAIFIRIPIIDDVTQEVREENFRVVITKVSSNAVLDLTRKSTTIMIIDNDITTTTSSKSSTTSQRYAITPIGSNDATNYQIERIDGEKIQHVAVYDLASKLYVQEEYLDEDKVTIDVTTVPDGIYIFVINTTTSIKIAL